MCLAPNPLQKHAIRASIELPTQLVSQNLSKIASSLKEFSMTAFYGNLQIFQTIKSPTIVRSPSRLPVPDFLPLQITKNT